jgi:hypothetical protein
MPIGRAMCSARDTAVDAYVSVGRMPTAFHLERGAAPNAYHWLRDVHGDSEDSRNVTNGRSCATFRHLDPLFRRTWHTIYTCSAGMHGTTGIRDRSGIWGGCARHTLLTIQGGGMADGRTDRPTGHHHGKGQRARWVCVAVNRGRSHRRSEARASPPRRTTRDAG